MSTQGALDRQVRRVVANGNCSGCGACSLIDPSLRMVLSDDGYLRPSRTAPLSPDAMPDAVRAFRAACPGVRMPAQTPAGSHRHPTMGPVVSAWEAWAADPATRFRGSSGGTLTALTAWLLETGQRAAAVTAAADPADVRRTVSVQIRTRAEALESAGSRYAPTGSAGVPAGLASGTATVGKPCEISAVRGLLAAGHAPTVDGVHGNHGTARDGRGVDSARDGDDGPLLLSFFCAGTPRQDATDSLVETLGVPRGTRLRELWYRGRGWPGSFTAVADDGTQVSTTYDDSWGRHLGPTVQWRCKICPDGVGESADITAADFWRADERGFPDFSDGDGVSALIARTRRGHDVVVRAIEAGVLVATPLDVDALAAMQPLQTQRRRTLAGRLVGAMLAGRRVPRFTGYSLIALAAQEPRAVVRAARGTRRRLLAARRAATGGRRG